MKVAVSIPDPLFREAEVVSKSLRVPRSQLYSRALETFVRKHSEEEVTARLNAGLRKVGTRVEAGWENPGLEVLRREKWTAGDSSSACEGRRRSCPSRHRQPPPVPQDVVRRD